MKKLLGKNNTLIISILVLAGGIIFLLYYMMRERKSYSFGETQSENGLIVLVLFLTGVLSAGFNLVSIYKVFEEKFRPAAALRIALLHFPLLLAQCVLIFAWLMLQVVF